VVAQYSMGYDFSKLDFIYFGDPKFSFKDIIQSIGRGFRPDGLGYEGTNLFKTLFVSLPVFINNEKSESDYDNIIGVLKYLLYDVKLTFEDIIFKTRHNAELNRANEQNDLGDELIQSQILNLLQLRKIIGYVTYKEARDINIENNITSPSQYREICKKDLRLREDAEKHYPGFDWLYFLGINREHLNCYTLDECIQKVTEYIKLYPRFKDYQLKLNELTHELHQLDKRFPPKDLWVYYYKAGLDTIIKFPKKKSKGIFG
jgi:hypothetical protein